MERFYAKAGYDREGRLHRPAESVIQPGAPPWIGPRGQSGLASEEAGEDLGDVMLLPPLVNAHAHLELTPVGPQPRPAGGFVDWVRMVRSYAMSAGGGEGIGAREWPEDTAAVGDIVSSLSGLPPTAGRRYLELFGMGPPFDEAALAAIATSSEGLQPHAPYSAGPSVYEAAVASGRPVSTHLAETRAELRFVAEGDGPFLDFLRELGKWDAGFAGSYGEGLTPVQWMRPYLDRTRWLLAHCNYVTDGDIATLAETGASVAYCPIASEYFGHEGHCYREMLDAGVNVCLGTDSIVCQPANEPHPLSVLPQMRRLYQRDRTDPAILLAMATTYGCRALGIEPSGVTVVSMDADRFDQPLRRALEGPAVATVRWPIGEGR